MSFDNYDMYSFIKMYSVCLNLNCELLNRLDANLSNRNHGSNLIIGFNDVFLDYPNFKNDNLSLQFFNLSNLYKNKVQGATSKIYSHAFFQISKYLDKDTRYITRDNFFDILKISEKAVRDIGICSLNDKTLLDCLHPAILSFEKNRNETSIKLFKQISMDCKIACDNTANMISKKGKARYNAIYSAGVIDPGAYSLFLMFDTLFKYFLKRNRRR